MTTFLRRLADGSRPGSAADRFRQKRFAQLRALVDSIPRPVRILDVGGTTVFWERLGWAGESGIDVVLLNLVEQETPYPNMRSTVGNALDLSRYGPAEFDVVISNSLIEHLPTFEQQARMAAEARRVGRRIYLQTPNRYFPLEPHFLFPFFGMLPIAVRAWLLQHIDLGWHKRRSDRAEALEDVRSIRLMTGSELRRLFPRASVTRERVFGLTKSFIILDGWDEAEA